MNPKAPKAKVSHWRVLLPRVSSEADTVRTSGAVRFIADSPEASDNLFLLEAEEA